MTKSLVLVRHAQSINIQSGIKDVDRNLTDKGIQDASKIGNYLTTIHLRPEFIYTSHAARALSTAQLIADQTGLESSEIIILEDLYEASLRILLKIINQLNENNKTIIIIGHNPSISYLCEFLTPSTIGEMAPAGICILNFKDISWENVNKATAELIEYKSPADIA